MAAPTRSRPEVRTRLLEQAALRLASDAPCAAATDCVARLIGCPSPLQRYPGDAHCVLCQRHATTEAFFRTLRDGSAETVFAPRLSGYAPDELAQPPPDRWAATPFPFVPFDERCLRWDAPSGRIVSTPIVTLRMLFALSNRTGALGLHRLLVAKGSRMERARRAISLCICPGFEMTADEAWLPLLVLAWVRPFVNFVCPPSPGPITALTFLDALDAYRATTFDERLDALAVAPAAPLHLVPLPDDVRAVQSVLPPRSLYLCATCPAKAAAARVRLFDRRRFCECGKESLEVDLRGVAAFAGDVGWVRCSGCGAPVLLASVSPVVEEGRCGFGGGPDGCRAPNPFAFVTPRAAKRALTSRCAHRCPRRPPATG